MNHPQVDISDHNVVGAARGVGRGIALAFAEAGAHVAVTNHGGTMAGRVTDEIRAMGRTALSLTGGAIRASDMERIIPEALREFGHVDTLVNCVGDSIHMPLSDLPDGSQGMSGEERHFIVDVTLTGAFQGSRALGPHLLESGSCSVINISGFASFLRQAGYVAYDAANARVMRLTESLAQEWAPYGVRINCVAPGYFPDPDQISTEACGEGLEQAKVQVLMGRLGNLREPGYLSVFLVSPAAAYIACQTWATDDGVGIESP